MPEGSAPKLPILLPSSTLPDAINLLLLPKELKLLSESKVEAKFVESLDPPAFYTFLTPDEDGECYLQEASHGRGGGGIDGEHQDLQVNKALENSSDTATTCWLLACLLWNFELVPSFLWASAHTETKWLSCSFDVCFVEQENH